MESTRRSFLAVTSGVVAGALAGCSGDSNGSDEPTATASPTLHPETTTPTESGGTSTSMESPNSGTVTVKVRDHPDLGSIVVDSEGMTLYMFDNDTKGAGESACSGGCATAWPPLIEEDDAVGGPGIEADLDTFERSNGDTQVSLGGWPLYYYTSDSSPGDATGQGVSDIWWVLRPDGTPVKDSGGGGGGGY